MATLKLIILFVFISLSAFAQIDSTLIFANSKGTWQYPISEFSKIEKYEKSSLCPTADFPIIATTFIADSSVCVKAIFDGTVITVVQVEDMYVIITRFGKYLITYTGIKKTTITKGGFITKGQSLGDLQKDIDDKFSISIYLNKGEEQIDPFNWFVHNDCP